MISQLNHNNISSHHAYDKFINQLLDILLASKGQEERRLQVIHFMNRLFASVGLSSFLYGSVALGTYLPDGDIDVSVFCRDLMTPHEWSKRVKKALCSNSDRIKGVSFINAQVKIYKCVIDDVSIDVSGNQIGGLCTLCFLERMNQKFAKDDLLKKSIVLVKAWSYYEARILASHHGLLSTYAITVLILFILNAYYDELETPLQVLIKFFEYFSDFDWDHYGIGILGPFPLEPVFSMMTPTLQESLHRGAGAGHEIPTPSSQNGSDAFVPHTHSNHQFPHSTTTMTNGLSHHQPKKFLCSPQFLQECVEKYGFTTDRPFQRKYFNILDPARADNNLGRSVSRSNYLRIRKVFKKGYNTLQQILNDDDPSQILTCFFRHSWERNQPRSSAQSTKNGHKRAVVTDMKKRNLLFQRKLEDFESHLEAAKEHLRLTQQSNTASFPMGPSFSTSPSSGPATVPAMHSPTNGLSPGCMMGSPSSAIMRSPIGSVVSNQSPHGHTVNGVVSPPISPSMTNGKRNNGKQSATKKGAKWKQSHHHNGKGHNGHANHASPQWDVHSPPTADTKKANSGTSSSASHKKAKKAAQKGGKAHATGKKSRPSTASSSGSHHKKKDRNHKPANKKQQEKSSSSASKRTNSPGGGYQLDFSDLLKNAKRVSKKGKKGSHSSRSRRGSMSEANATNGHGTQAE